MYRPNRIGPWPIIDLDAPKMAWDASWNATLGVADFPIGTAPTPHFRSATVRDDFDFMSIKMDGNTPTLLNHFSMAFGVAIEGENPVDGDGEATLFSVFASMMLSDDTTGNEHTASLWVGRLDQSTVDVTRNQTNNSVTNPILLPALVTKTGTSGNIHLAYNGSFLFSDIEADGYDSNPIVAGVTINNPDSAAREWTDFHLSLGIHRYVGDLKSFEPNR